QEDIIASSLRCENRHSGNDNVSVLQDLYLIMDSDVLKILHGMKDLLTPGESTSIQLSHLPSLGDMLDAHPRPKPQLTVLLADLCRHKAKAIDPIMRAAKAGNFENDVIPGHSMTTRQELRSACMVLAAGLGFVLTCSRDDDTL